MHLLTMVADRLWLVSGGTVTPFDDDLEAYRKLLLAPAQQGGKTARQPKEAKPAKPVTRDEVLALKAEVRKSEARVEKLTEMQEKLAAKLADPALYEDEKHNELAVWNRKYAEVMEALERAEGLWMTAAEKLEQAQAG